MIDHHANEFTSEARSQLANDEWRRKFRGREILRRFVGRQARGLRYENFRDLIIARMRDAEHKPLGMTAIIQEILKDPWFSEKLIRRHSA